ncbi:hypothetical protein [Paenibacillus cucumis (ex Kampfer et al. 2016)]|uniref:Uncharacterized protein n=1 Tax=Paenibacillus cucumis (ex Kampfer et al. 2016) TaxID=1776858 RepID=A0ABS7KM91_9BACL|nr:hypothetical protein [Paenibacillus cucumis (ex Kampfer et al. 2016)]MBY0205249.1 hypothetical protein [Paenibacillus cucumis (ex Kampfer et al. 2016)]
MTITRGRQSKKRAESNFSGGINQGIEPFGLPDTQSVDEVGFDTDDYPYLSTSRSHSVLGSSGGSTTYLLTNFGTSQIIRAVGTALQYNAGGTSWFSISGTFSATDWDATNFEVAGSPALILTNGIDNPQYWTGSALGTLGGTPPKGKYITNDTVRVWMAVDDTLFFSGFQNAADWTSTENSGFLQYYTERGGNITALKNFYGDKYVWKRDSMAVVQGTNYFNYKVKEISNDVGCVSFKTVQEVGDTLMWLGESDVYLFQGGFPVPIGEPVRKYIDRINPSYLDRCSAFHDGNRYYLNLVIDSASQPNIRLVYDLRYKIWRVPGQNENFRYGVRFNNETYAGNDAGQTYQINANTSAGAWSITTKPFDEGMPEAEKEYKEIHLQGVFYPATQYTISFSVDDRGETFVPVSYNPLNADLVALNKNAIIPLDTTPLTHWMRFRISGTGRITIYNWQRYFRVCRVQH